MAAPPTQDWAARHRVAAEVFAPWVDAIHPLAGKAVLEYGSGRGAAGCAFGAAAERLAGYDIEPRFVREAERRATELGLEGVSFAAVPPDEIRDRVRRHAGEIDVFLLYAVLEHLTVDERLAVMRLALEVVRGDGVIVVIETPNRLVDSDFHTSLLPFFDQLPTELALAYASRSSRDDFRESVLGAREAAEDHGALAFARWGTGVSYHEFELVFGDLGDRVLGGGYDPALLGERSIHVEELALARHLERVRPDLPPPFSRCWLDLVISPRPLDARRQGAIRPWVAETLSSPGAGWTRWDTIAIDAGVPLAIEPREATERVVCVLSAAAPTIEVTARSRLGEASAVAAGDPGHQVIAALELGGPVDSFTLEASTSSHVHFVGYEASAGAGADG